MTFEIPQAPVCPFCDYLADRRPCAFVSRGRTVSSFLNRAQYERGALLVVPNIHVESILALNEDLLSDVCREARRLARLLIEQLDATGVNVFQNNGISAGQTIPHYHVHVVPRYATSDPARVFREADFPVTPFAELEVLARELCAARA